VTRRFAVLVNPVAAGGSALRAVPAVTAELDRLGAAYRTVETRSLDHARDDAEVAARDGETVAALGGDGLVRPVAAGLRDTEAALALLPGGRGNDFARVLGVPADPAAAARVAVEGEERLVDVGEVDGEPYVGIASLGFDSEANRFANGARLVPGHLVYVYAALRALVSWRPAAFTVVVGGERHELVGFAVAVANSGAYGGGMYLVPHAELDDGQLDVMLTGRVGKLRFLRDFPKVFRGAHVGAPHVRFLRGRVVEVRSERPFTVYADGDPIGATPAVVRVRRRCLRVVVPRRR
jgi:YegS/Rv2252/BmrU family lipid kinase